VAESMLLCVSRDAGDGVSPACHASTLGALRPFPPRHRSLTRDHFASTVPITARPAAASKRRTACLGHRAVAFDAARRFCYPLAGPHG